MRRLASVFLTRSGLGFFAPRQGVRKDGSRALGEECLRVPTSVTFGATETEQTFTFMAVEDTEDDDGESVTLGFGATLPPGASLGRPPTTVVTITDDDDPAPPGPVPPEPVPALPLLGQWLLALVLLASAAARCRPRRSVLSRLSLAPGGC